MISDYLIVDKKILPENVLLVVEANRLISEKKISISDACKEVGISRGTFYKYNNSVFLPSKEFGKKAIFTFILEHNKGVLSNLLNFVASLDGNVLAITQEMPIHNSAFVTLTVDVIEMKSNLNDFLNKVLLIEGVKTARLIAVE